MDKNTTEQPLVTLGEIARFLKVSEDVARRMLKELKVPLLAGYKKSVAVMPADLISALRQNRTKAGTHI